MEKFRLTSWKCLKRRTPTSVGTRALSVSHSKFSFPTSVSTVPLLPPLASTPFLYFESRGLSSSRVKSSRIDRTVPMQPGRPEDSLLRGYPEGIERARYVSQHGAAQVLEPFERIWPIKRGLRAALSSGLTQSTSFLSPRPLFLSLVLSPVLAATLPVLCVIPGCIIPPRFSHLLLQDASLPRHPRPFQSMSSRQRAFRYFQEPVSGFYSLRGLGLDGFLIGTSREVARLYIYS